ncbi:YolD-like family protein [Paenibacillus thiaminolyticus]|uniref:YolD-like family protein n=1 Tax=Paenibacillus thiaminolyticus TaxID=49283 RepID=UPI0011637370|nr:YolD-like family protein [Paenibacillus thiaminolyticus]NGP58331.1 YolD-like family protein [Paenibacillus thiaminolyticus]WCR26614.1 YolD-like family protein [Paenibacillus thiaminolyticus]
MLPEHVRMLREWQNEDRLTERPLLDEFYLGIIGEELELAFKRKCEVRIKTWNDGYIKQFRGKILEIKPDSLVYDHSFGTSRIQLNEIISVESLD